MTMELHQVDLVAHNDSIRLDTAALVSRLREILGAQLVAYLGSVNETRAVSQWAEGVRAPRGDVLHRLRTAYRVAALLDRRESRASVQAWFQGLNPMLEDRSPARLLREGTDVDAAQVIVAARNFAGAA